MNLHPAWKGALAAAVLSGLTAASAQDSQGPAPEGTPTQTDLPLRDIPVLEQAFIDLAPAKRDDGISVAALGLDTNDRDALINLAQEIGDGQYGNFDSLLIAHQDQLVFESYFQRGRINLPHGQASATKSYTGLLVGRAMQLGYLTMADLDRPVASFFDDLDTALFVDGAERVTLHQTMSMRSGIRISAEEMEELSDNPAPIQGRRQVQTLLERSAPITAQSQEFLYQGTDPDLTMQVIEAVVPGTAEEFIKSELLDPLGITNYRWPMAANGLPVAGAGVKLTSRDMIKLGSLVINNGQWQGEQLIPADYLVKATSGLTSMTIDWIPDNYLYGYFWYDVELAVGDKVYTGKKAWGGGGQRILTIADLDLVIAITGHDREDTIMEQVTSVILPAFVE